VVCLAASTLSSSWAAAPALSASNRQAFQHCDGFDESLSFESEIGQHLIDIHKCKDIHVAADFA
jgi:hypothetical protein